MKKYLTVYIVLFTVTLMAAPVPKDRFDLFKVDYAVVPHDKLAEAIASPSTARTIEEQWTQSLATGPMPTGRDFSIIIFIRCSDAMPATGMLRIWLSEFSFRDVSISGFSLKRDSVYVIDGGLQLISPAGLKKHYEWLKLEYLE
jgi:hypothetical protein